MKRGDADYSRIKIDILFHKISHHARIDLSAARKCDVRMPWTQLRLEPGGERCFLNAFVDLK